MVAMVAMVPHRMAVLAFAMASAAPEAPALRGAPGADLRSSWQHAGCCNGCNTAFCSPQSGSCYDYKGKYCYLECGSGSSPQGSLPAAQPHADCCDSCSGSSYCSPASGTCYASKGKDYYLECAGPRPDFVKVANYACTTSVQSETFYDLSSHAECQEKCFQFSWCRFFQFKDGTVDSCLGGSRTECEVLSTCDDVIDASCWDYYHG